jgi:hypothetical protein
MNLSDVDERHVCKIRITCWRKPQAQLLLR